MAKHQILRGGILRGQNRAIAMWAGTNFKAAELHGMTLFNRGDLALKDSLTPTRGAGVRGVGGGGPGWGKSAFCYRIWCLLLSNTIVSMCIVSVFCMYFCPYLAIFLRIRRIHRIHVSDAYPTCIRCIHLYPPSRPKYARICPRIRTVDSHSVGRKRGFVSILYSSLNT